LSTALDGQVTISLPKGTLLVLFELLALSYDSWKRSGSPQLAESTFVLPKPDAGERTALWDLEGVIEDAWSMLLAEDGAALLGHHSLEEASATFV
jgi:hypothetical protein